MVLSTYCEAFEKIGIYLKKIKVAISAEDSLFCCNRILNPDWARKFPGASWLPILQSQLEPEFEVVTADVALSHVCEGYWNAEDILVIQHVHDNVACSLIERGTFPLAITCFESPLYVGKFYDNVAQFAPHFKFRILFSGLHALYNSKGGVNHQATFPSYFQSDLDCKILPLDQRKFLVAVIGNKYVVSPTYQFSTSPLQCYWWLRKRLAQFIYNSFSSKKFPVHKVQLQDTRLELISFFMEKGLLDLYGKGWDVLRNLPPKWQKKLSPIFKSFPPQPCENKLETIRNYRYGLCVENAKFPGYVTEKIIDCLVAGVIPLYMGAPDIEKYIPPSCFVDLRQYSNLDDVLTDLQSMTESDALLMIKSGQEFLQSDIGRNYSYEGFANFMANIIRSKSKMTL